MTGKYQIKIKRDWGRYGFWNPKTRRLEKQGFVVVKGGCNIMPGAVWFKTVEQAIRAIAILEQASHDADLFWQLMKEDRKNAAWS